ALNAATAAAQQTVDQRSDIYSLGVVLFELLTGSRPFSKALPDEERTQKLARMVLERRTAIPSLRHFQPDMPQVLNRILVRCLAPQPQQRYQTAADLAGALGGCRDLFRIQKEMPAAGLLTRATERHPIGMLLVLVLLPQLVGSVVNISYNSLRIVSALTDAQQATFSRLVLVYNLIVYPLCVVVLCVLIFQLFLLV